MNIQAAVNVFPLRTARHLPPPYPSLCFLLQKIPNSLTFVPLQPPQKPTGHSSSTITNHLAWITVKAQSPLLYTIENNFTESVTLGWEVCLWILGVIYVFINILRVLLPIFHVSEVSITPTEQYFVESYLAIIFQLELVKCGQKVEEKWHVGNSRFSICGNSEAQFRQ